MTKSTAFLLCIACLVAGFVFGQHSLDTEEMTKEPMYETLLTDMTSQGRAGITALQKRLMQTQAALISDIYFEQTRALKEAAADTPDKDTVFRLAAQAREKQCALQHQADQSFLETLLSLPLHDRETYLRHHLKNREYLTEILIVQPLMTEIKTLKQPSTKRPRDAVVRQTNVPTLSR